MPTITIDYTPQPRQVKFHECPADEVLYGGAAGGGKSRAILMDALANAMRYAGCHIIMFRRTFPELERSLILESRVLYPSALGRYNESKKRWTFINSSTIEFSYLDKEADVFNYQGAEYDFIYFDELTHFTETQYTYMKSRLRGTTKIHRQVKSATNPGGIGHNWVRNRFVDVTTPETLYRDTDEQTRCFIPAKVYDNAALIEADPTYIKRLESLDERTKKQLLDGDWDAFAGQMFTEWSRDIHVVAPFEIPDHWTKVRAIDEGFNDPFVCLWLAFDEHGKAYVYRELSQSQLLTSQQVEKVLELTPSDEKIRYTVADTSMWAKGKDSGISPAEIFAQNGIPLTQATKERVNGWMRVREYLHVYEQVDPTNGAKVASSDIAIFDTCRNLISNLPVLVCDENKPEDIADGQWDHECLVAGTLIETIDGLVPIEDVKPFDLVLTRRGYKPVVDQSITSYDAEVYTVEFSNGTSITATANHPVFVHTKGFVRVDSLRYGDIIMVSPNWEMFTCQESKKLCTTGTPTDGILVQSTSQTEHTSSAQTETGQSTCTRKCGKITTEQKFQKAITSTTKTETLPTTALTTLNAYHQPNTYHSTADSTQATQNTWHAYENLLNDGTLLNKGESGTDNTESRHGRCEQLSRKLAQNAVQNSIPSQDETMTDSALTSVSRHGVEKADSMTLLDNASTVEQSSPSTSTNHGKLVPKNAKFVCGVKPNTERAVVYNITVFSCPEYYANGVLVHNCDALRYGLMSRPPRTKLPKQGLPTDPEQRWLAEMKEKEIKRVKRRKSW